MHALRAACLLDPDATSSSHSCKVSSLPDSMQHLSIMGWGWDVNAHSPTISRYISKSY